MHSEPKDVLCTILIPAYNEAASIKQTLDYLLDGTSADDFDVLLVCNGCKDKTAEIAKSAHPCIRVIDLEKASKSNAINEGLKVAQKGPIVFLDADIKVSAMSVRYLLHALKWHDVDMVYGRAHFNFKETSICVQAFYKAWFQNTYFDQGKMGGFFALSASAVAKLESMPNILSDDEYIRRLFVQSCTCVKEAHYTINPPRNLASLINVRCRIYRGNKQLSAQGMKPTQSPYPSPNRLFLSRLMKRPRHWFGAVVFAYVAVCAHLRNRLHTTNTHWERDMSNRASQNNV